jgi:hypothetical protein
MKRGHYVNDWDCLTLEDRNDWLFRNVSKQLPSVFNYFYGPLELELYLKLSSYRAVNNSVSVIEAN